MLDMFQKTGVSHSCVKQTVTFDVFEVSGAKRSFLKERCTEMKWWTTKKETAEGSEKESLWPQGPRQGIRGHEMTSQAQRWREMQTCLSRSANWYSHVGKLSGNIC